MSLIGKLIAPQLRAKNLSFDLDYDEPLPAHFEGDAGRVRQIAMNFVSNAIKFTEAGSVRVKIKPLAASYEQGIRIQVTDTGCGIPAAKIGSLFQQFVQADASTTRRYGGTGLGLAISKRLAEMMGGSVGAASVVGEGSTFWAELPLRPAKVPLPSQQSTQSWAAPLDQSLRVLIAEDNLVNQKLTSRILLRMGCQIQVANDGAEAVALYSAEPFDVVLMDCHMPVCDGYQATVAIRQMEKEDRKSRVPIIALTANAADVDRDRCFAAGMDAYLTKPIFADRLREVLSHIAANPALPAEQRFAEIER